MPRYLMGTTEIRDRLGGVSRAQAFLIMNRPDFPVPYDILSQGMIWRKEDVESWLAANTTPADAG